MLNSHIKHPWIAAGVIFGVAAILSRYGVTKGTLLIFDVFAVIGIYKWFTSGRD